MDCCEKTVAIPLGIFVPIRDIGTTKHSDVTAQTLATITLPEDDLTENLMVTLLGEHTNSTVRVAYQIPLMITRRADDSPAYSVNLGSQSYMVDEDPDIEVEVEADGSNGINLNIIDQSGDAGQIDWNYQIWTLDQLKHSSESSPYLLDTYLGSEVAYSLRQLKTGVSNVIRVRRSSDNSEQDFTAEQVEDGTLLSFVGANDGLVVTWYDQSGNGNHASQATAGLQPVLVSSGAFCTNANGDRCLDFATNTSEFGLSDITASPSDFTVIGYIDPPSVSESVHFLFDCATGRIAFSAGGTLGSLFDGAFRGTDIITDANAHLISWVGRTTGNTYDARVDATIIDNAVTFNPRAMSGVLMGHNVSCCGTVGDVSEVIVFTTARSDILDIETAINNHYSIF